MKFFLDTEFMEDGKSIELISIGVVAEDGREFYKQNANADLKRANPWIRENVIPRLLPCPKGITHYAHRASPCRDETCPWKPYHLIGRELFEFVNSASWTSGSPMRPNDPEFWGYYADYDWVALCFLFGRMIDFPQGWPMYCRDLKQWADELGNVELPAQTSNEHNALGDARWNRDIHYYLSEEVKYRARQGNEQPISARKVRKEPGHLRSPEAAGQGQVHSSGDQ